MASYASRVGGDIRRWQEAGWIDAATAAKLSADTEARAGSRISFASILAMLAALLFAAGLLVFAAADWASLPKSVRLGGIAALVVLFTFGGALLEAKGRGGFAQAAWLAGSASWGAGIFLLGAPPDVALDERMGLLTWCLGTAFAAALFPSGPLTVAATGLAAGWLLAKAPWLGGADGIPYYSYPLLAAGLWAVSLRTQSRRARELLLVSLPLFFFLLAQRAGALPVGMAVAGGFAVLFALASFRAEQVEAVLRLAGRAPLLLLLNSFGGLAIVQGELLGETGFALSAASALAVVAAALLIAGRRNTGVRRLCYLVFAVELCVIFGVTVGTVLDTVSFFLAGAALLAMLAMAVFRLERRWGVAPVPEAVQ